MRNRRLILPVLLCVLAARTANAQPPALSPERQAAVLEAGRRMNDPVDFVLRHRTELALTPPQMASLEKLAVALRDSSAARTARRMRQAQQYARLPGLASVMQWNGAVDESAIREAMRQQSLLQAEIMIASARDRRAVGAILTPTQLAKLPQLQTAEMLKAAQGESR